MNRYCKPVRGFCGPAVPPIVVSRQAMAVFCLVVGSFGPLLYIITSKKRVGG